MGNRGVVIPPPTFLHTLREVTEKSGSLLIFDEVITGFRVGPAGAQGLWGVRPDLTCLGKIIGGGFPVAAVGGRKEIMDLLAPLGPVYQAGTWSAHPIGMKAGLQTLECLVHEKVYLELEEKGRYLEQRLDRALQNIGVVQGLQRVGSMLSFHLQHPFFQRNWPERFAGLFRYLWAQGVYLPPGPYESWFFSTAHDEKGLEKMADLVSSYIETTGLLT
jgi:glutamate-1-semialdehyde 2,1-aminomutase